MKVGDRVMLTGDNFEIPDVGTRGTVVEISEDDECVFVDFDDDTSGEYTKYQAGKWLVIVPA